MSIEFDPISSYCRLYSYFYRSLRFYSRALLSMNDLLSAEAICQSETQRFGIFLQKK